MPPECPHFAHATPDTCECCQRVRRLAPGPLVPASVAERSSNTCPCGAPCPDGSALCGGWDCARPDPAPHDAPGAVLYTLALAMSAVATGDMVGAEALFEAAAALAATPGLGGQRPVPRAATEAQYVAAECTYTEAAGVAHRDATRLRGAALASGAITLLPADATVSYVVTPAQALADALAQVASTCGAGPASAYPERVLVDLRASAERLLARPLPKAVRAPMAMARERALELLAARCWDLAYALRSPAVSRWLVGALDLIEGA